MDDEDVLLETRRHVATLFRPFLLTVLVVVVALVIGTLVSPREGGDVVDVVVGGVACLFILRLLARVWQWRVAKTVVTDRRLFQVSGIFTRKVSSIPLSRMTDLTYRRPFIGRLLGYGEIVVESAGEHGLARLDHVPRSNEFYRAVTRAVSSLSPRLDDALVPQPNWDEEDTGPLPRVVV